MKRYYFATPLWVFFVITGSFCACQSKQQPVSAGRSVAQPVANLQRLTGTWVSSRESHNGFSIMHINADSTGTYTAYQDEGELLHSQHRNTPHYYFSEGAIKVRYRPRTSSKIIYIPNIEVEIWVKGARFDYELAGDTLREIDKMGYQGSFIRMHNTHPD